MQQRNLTKAELKCLKSIQKQNINFKDYSSTIETLSLMGYVHCESNIEGVLNISSASLTPKGISYLETYECNKRKYFSSEFRSWLAIVISIFALIVSIIALLYK